MQKWNIKSQYPSGDRILDGLLLNRGLSSADEINEFINTPDLEFYLKGLPNDFKVNLKNAISFIRNHVDKKLPLIIHGDYDADGVCATAILLNYFKNELGYEGAFAFIPNRFDHGYGLSKESVSACIEKLTSHYGNFPKDILFLTVDSGITAVEVSEHIKELGHYLIITDHHQKGVILPTAQAILWDDSLVGASIAWILARFLGSNDSQSLSLAGLATVTDVQSVRGFNRFFVKNGLEVLNTNPPAGIAALLKFSKRSESEVTTYDLGWIIGPRINAAGRLKDASDALLLLTDKNPKIIESVALKLEDINFSRQEKTEQMFSFVEPPDATQLLKFVLTAREEYHEGIIGLVASRIVREHNCPAFVVSIEGEFGKGSVRSIPGIDVTAVLKQVSDLFENVGGHPMAAGFTIRISNIDLLHDHLLSHFENHVSEELYERNLDIDMEIPFSCIEEDLISDIDKLRPYGVGNAEPLFATKEVTVTGLNWVGTSKSHLSLRFLHGVSALKGICFGVKDKIEFDNLKVGDKIDLAYKVRENYYNGNTEISLHIIDIKPCI